MTPRRVVLGAVAVLGIVVGVDALHGDEAESRRVLVLPLTAPPGPEGAAVAEAARDLLCSALAAESGVTLVEREQLAAVLAEQRSASALGPTDALPVGGLLSASHLVSGAVASDASGWRFTMTVVHVPDGVRSGAVDEKGSERELGATAARAAAQVRRLLASPSAPPTRGDEHASASLHFLRGLGLHRAGLEVEAIGELLEARRLAVRLPETRFWTGEAYLASGSSAHAAIAFEDFLAEAPTHVLAPRARESLATAKGAEAAARPTAARPKRIVETLLSNSTAAERAEAIERAAARGAAGLDDLEAAADLPDDVGEVARILDAVRAIDPERFVALVLRHPNSLRHATTWRAFRDAFTPARATRFARGMLSRHAAVRDEVIRFLAETWPPPLKVEPPWMTPEALAAFHSGILKAAASEDAEISRAGFVALGDSPDVIPVVAKRLLDETIAPAYRASVIAQSEARGRLSPALCDAVLVLIGDSRDVLRHAAIRFAQGGYNEYSPPAGPERDRLIALSQKFTAKARELLASRRFPDDAVELAAVVRSDIRGDDDPDGPLAEALLHSSNSVERVAALRLFRPAREAEAAARASLKDADPTVRCVALQVLGRSAAAPEQTFHEVVALWKRRLGPGAPTAATRIECSWYASALGALTERARSQGRPPRPKAETATPDDWEAWFLQ